MIRYLIPLGITICGLITCVRCASNRKKITLEVLVVWVLATITYSWLVAITW